MECFIIWRVGIVRIIAHGRWIILSQWINSIVTQHIFHASQHASFNPTYPTTRAKIFKTLSTNASLARHFNNSATLSLTWPTHLINSAKLAKIYLPMNVYNVHLISVRNVRIIKYLLIMVVKMMCRWSVMMVSGCRSVVRSVII